MFPVAPCKGSRHLSGWRLFLLLTVLLGRGTVRTSATEDDMNPMINTYLNKHFADFTAADREALRRYDQGQAHAKQGRTDLLGQCPHYDAGYKAG